MVIAGNPGRPSRPWKYPAAPKDARYEGQPHERLRAAYEWQMGVWGWLSQPPRSTEASLRLGAQLPPMTAYVEVPMFARLPRYWMREHALDDDE